MLVGGTEVVLVGGTDVVGTGTPPFDNALLIAPAKLPLAMCEPHETQPKC